VFNNQNLQNNQQKNDYDRRNHKSDIENYEQEYNENKQEQPRKNNKNKFKNRKNNHNRKEETKELIAQVTEILEQANATEDVNEVMSVETPTVEPVVEEKPVKTTKKRTTRKSKKADVEEPTLTIAPDNTENQNTDKNIAEKAEEKPAKKTKTRKASRTRKKTVENDA